MAESGEGVIALHFSQLPFIPYLLYSMMMVANFFASYHSLSDFYPLAISFSHTLSLSRFDTRLGHCWGVNLFFLIVIFLFASCVEGSLRAA